MIVTLEEDENGDLILPLPPTLFEGDNPWLINDVLSFKIDGVALVITNKTWEERKSNK